MTSFMNMGSACLALDIVMVNRAHHRPRVPYPFRLCSLVTWFKHLTPQPSSTNTFVGIANNICNCMSSVHSNVMTQRGHNYEDRLQRNYLLLLLQGVLLGVIEMFSVDTWFKHLTPKPSCTNKGVCIANNICNSMRKCTL